MIQSFTYTQSPARIVFGSGARDDIAIEARKIGCSRALVLATPFQREDAEKLAADLMDLAVGVFAEATMHTPVSVTEKALAATRLTNADCVVALGGGSTTGLAKAISYRTGVPQVIIPTTYAGSEVTPILGQTENGVKSTLTDSKVLPDLVIYDPDLTTGLPVNMSVTSGLNAMAHAVEALYAKDRNPVSSLMAAEGLNAFHQALPKIVSDPADKAARTLALYGAWLCGSVLGAVGMSLHHKLCHTLGGTFDLPHAETHSVVLPHAAAYNAAAARAELQPLADTFGGDVPGGLFDFAQSLGAPMSLRSLGLTEDQIDKASDLAVSKPYWNPRPVERDLVRDLLMNALEGVRPH